MYSFDAMLHNWELFLLIAVRVTSIFTTAPFFGSQSIPMKIRVLVPMSISLVIFPFVPTDHFQLEQSFLGLALLIVSELAIGLILSFFCNVTFEVFNFGGFLLSRQMGFAMARVVDPQTQDQTSLVGVFYNFMATLLLLTMNGHHMLIRALRMSFEVVPISMFTLRAGLSTMAIQATSRLFALALMFALPVFGTLMITNVIMGIVAKTIPEIKIFLLQLPLKISVGLGGMALIMPIFIHIIQLVLSDLFDQLEQVLELMA